MMKRSALRAVFCLALAWTTAAQAQTRPASGEGVANSGLEQGEAMVSVRSDVRLAIKGIRATLSDRLAGMTGAVSGRMPAIRECYSKVVATRPATVGGIRAVIVLAPDSGAPSIEMSQIDGADGELSTCVGKVLRQLDLRAVERPAAVEITLTFGNSRAQGQAQSEQHQAAFVANVERKPDGIVVGHWRTDGGEIEFSLEVREPDGEDLASALVGAVRAAFSGFVDCRRRAARHGMSSAGEIVVDLRVGRDGKVAGHTVRATVEDQKRTPGCVEKAASRLELEPQRRAARAVLNVHFAGS